MFTNLAELLTKIWSLKMKVAFVIIVISYDDDENGGMAEKDGRRKEDLPG